MGSVIAVCMTKARAQAAIFVCCFCPPVFAMQRASTSSSGRSAVGYTRTSSSTNCGFMKDSEPRQREAIQACVDHFGLILGGEHSESVGWFSDPSVKGTDDVHTRPGFVRLLDFCNRTGVRDIVFEDASRLARDLITQEVAFNSLTKLGFRLYSAASPNVFLDEGETAKLVRCVLGAIHEFERAGVVKRLASSRERAAGQKFRLGTKRTLANKPKAIGRHGLLERWPTLTEVLVGFLEHAELTDDLAKQARDIAYSKGIKNKNGKCLAFRQLRTAFARVQALHV